MRRSGRQPPGSLRLERDGEVKIAVALGFRLTGS
jgi:hypothetical protein